MAKVQTINNFSQHLTWDDQEQLWTGTIPFTPEAGQEPETMRFWLSAAQLRIYLKGPRR